jgi:hypothetical protein
LVAKRARRRVRVDAPRARPSPPPRLEATVVALPHFGPSQQLNHHYAQMTSTDFLILQRRPLSARLVFFTARRLEQGEGEEAETTTTPTATETTTETTELVVKEATYEGEGGVEHVRRDVRAGDVVRVVEVVAAAAGAEADANAAVVVSRLETLRRWKDGPGKDGRTFNWAVSAAAGAPGPPAATPPCKYFLNTGRCAKGAACPFSHDPPTAEQRRAWVGERAAARRRRAAPEHHDEDDANDIEGGAAAKAQRARIFAAWIGAAFFGGGPSSGADSVVDVAGGRGALTFELAALVASKGDGAEGDDDSATTTAEPLIGRERVTLVDPRPLRLNRRQALRLRLQQEAARGGGGGNGSTKSSKKARWRVEDVLTGEAVSQSRGPADAEGDDNPAASSQIVFRQARACFGAELWRSEAWRRAVEEGGGSGSNKSPHRPVVVALHPDQATDAALDYALERKLPFAIVPCCVFPALFPERRFGPAPGQPVRSYEDLVAYLVERSGGEVAVLPFVGRNVVVYGGGASASPSAEAVMAADRAAAREAARPPPEFARPSAGKEAGDDDDDEEEDDEEGEEAGGQEGAEEEGGLFEGGALLRAGRRQRR